MHRGYHGLALPTWERKFRVFGDWTSTFLIKRDASCTMGTLGDENPRSFFETFAVK
jgi:NADH dehydrogenase